MADVLEISRLALHDQVVARLRGLLVQGRIAPGAKLNERELCEQLGVSRTPLREAIKLLAAEGLVDLVPNRGAVAVRLTEEDVLHTFEVLGVLEATAGEMAAQRITPEELAELRAMHYEMLACHARHDLPGYYAFNARIHDAISAAAHNPVLAQTYRSINARAQSLRFRTNQDEAKWKHAVHEHEQMMDALARRDGAAMRAILTSHLQRKRDLVLELMRAGLLYPDAPAAPRRTRRSA
ncbi:GntR family transcriptional regulator [Bordetella ansorpii]|uniref:GntR family transcriptional regulator n=1 Tax=Bordetella ansorpii TaxID=288768 RepID=A0A157MXH7_9BORD|nr:GntR family transcriptional regulator [Bordetella ansorpii]SAI13663.1 GntR family transcriptional regulator [Bordetella ansorpii]